MKHTLLLMLSAIPFMAQAQTADGNDADKPFEYAVTRQYGAPTLVTPLKDIQKITVEQGQLVFHGRTGNVIGRAPLGQLMHLSFDDRSLTGIAQATDDSPLPDLTENDLAHAEVFTLAGIKVGADFKQLPRGVYIVKHAGRVRKLMKR